MTGTGWTPNGAAHHRVYAFLRQATSGTQQRRTGAALRPGPYQGELDFRIPTAQGLSTFTALQRRGVESKLLVFPDENHRVLKPANSLLCHHTVIGWLDRHLKR